jgi:hypothetical protein
MNFVTTRVSAISTDGDNPIFGESVTHIELCDEAAGFYIKLSQTHDDIVNGELTFNSADEIESIAVMARQMIREAEESMK